MGTLDKLKLRLTNLFKIKINRSEVTPLRIFQKNKKFYLVFHKKNNPTGYEVVTKSIDGFSFEVTDEKYSAQDPLSDFPKGIIVDDYQWEDQKLMFYGDRNINIACLEDGKKWQTKFKSLITNVHPVEVANVFVRKESLMLLYYEKLIENKIVLYSAHLAFFDKKNPTRLLWKTNRPIWKQVDLWSGEKIIPIGAAIFNEKLISYWYKENQGIFGVIFSGFDYDLNQLNKQRLKLEKHVNNPIISPDQENSWEAFNTFNPAAIRVDDKVHILYRAQGFDYISSVGYASSRNGLDIDERFKNPIFYPTKDFENNKKTGVNYDFMSGGGYGGCEDPRITKIDNKIYMIYVAFDGWSPPRLALTSILISNFLRHRWLWSKPVLISPPGIVDKSGCLLSEKINNKYVFFHRVFPNILIDYVDDLNFNGKNNWLRGQFQIKVRPNKWDSRKIGVGAPPLKTKDGWLMIYYGVDDRDAGKYHIGAMLLDLKDPTKVLYRSDSPILQPTEEYENNGFKPGIAYPCGAVIVKNRLIVYYGAADSVVCVATASLDVFIKELKTKKPIHLYSLKVKEVDY